LNAANLFDVSVPSHIISLENCSASVVSLFFMFHKRNNEILSFVEDVRSQTSQMRTDKKRNHELSNDIISLYNPNIGDI
jgi:hypothetical protein